MRFDFPTLMVALVAVTGVIWLLDVVLFAPRRESGGAAQSDAEDGHEEVLPQTPDVPKVVEYARSFFPVFLIVLVLRSFLYEPFRIPSGSMMPTLLIGDFILVNKYTYGIRLPVSEQKIISIGTPERGDVVVFRYPEDPSIPFIKRVVGLPGDQIIYRNKVMYVNGDKVELKQVGSFVGQGSGSKFTGLTEFEEALPGSPHNVLLSPRFRFPRSEGTWTVPKDSYFVLGDNRDNSEDSRFWGFVPDANLIGKAVSIWMSWDLGHGPKWNRFGTSIE